MVNLSVAARRWKQRRTTNLHVRGSTGLRSGRRDLHRVVGSRDDDLGEGDRVVGDEDDL